MRKKSRQFPSFQRATNAPHLPATPFRFICHFVSYFRWWYLLMVILETLHATCGIMLPYAIGEIMRTVTKFTGDGKPMMADMSHSLIFFSALSIGEVLFGRLSGLCHTILHPIHRQHVTRCLYSYLQHHSHRYLSSSFAGALAHRITETSMGVTQTLAMLINEFMPIIIMFSVSTVLLYQAHYQLATFVGVWAVLFISISFWMATRCPRLWTDSD